MSLSMVNSMLCLFLFSFAGSENLSYRRWYVPVGWFAGKHVNNREIIQRLVANRIEAKEDKISIPVNH